MTVKRRKMPAVLLMGAALMVCLMVFSACGGGSSGSGGQEMIGPRSKDAWDRWEEQQKALRETWEGTEIYDYVQTIMKDLQNVNAHVVLGEGFSLEAESKERDAFLKLYEDMNLEIPPEEFLSKLSDDSFGFAVGRKNELDSIAERKDGNGNAYDVVLLYYPNHESLMAVEMPVIKDEGGRFTLRELFPAGEDPAAEILSGAEISSAAETSSAAEAAPRDKLQPETGGTAASQIPAAEITEEQALAMAAGHAGVKKEELSFHKIEQDFEHGKLVYEIEFYVGRTEYEYDIDAVTGDILKFSMEKN